MPCLTISGVEHDGPAAPTRDHVVAAAVGGAGPLQCVATRRRNRMPVRPIRREIGEAVGRRRGLRTVLVPRRDRKPAARSTSDQRSVLRDRGGFELPPGLTPIFVLQRELSTG